MPSFLLLVTALLFSSGTWACPKKPTSPCETCPDHSFYPTDRCDDPEGCNVIPFSQVLTPSVGSNGCKEVDMECPEGSMVGARIDGHELNPFLWTEFKSGFTNIVCSADGKWLITFGDTGAVLDYIYCYNKNCSQCPDLRAPTAAECDSTDCQAPILNYTYGGYPGAECRQITIDCLPIPAGFNTFNIEIIYSTGSRKMFTVDEFLAGDAGELACSNQAKWTNTPPGGIGEAISTIACHYT